MTSLEAALRQIHTDLTEAHVSFAVGGLAVSARTEPRFTRDADLAVALASDGEAEALSPCALIGREPAAWWSDEGEWLEAERAGIAMQAVSPTALISAMANSDASSWRSNTRRVMRSPPEKMLISNGGPKAHRLSRQCIESSEPHKRIGALPNGDSATMAVGYAASAARCTVWHTRRNEPQFLFNEELACSRTFPPYLFGSRTSRERAVFWAEAERKAITGRQKSNG